MLAAKKIVIRIFKEMRLTMISFVFRKISVQSICIFAIGNFFSRWLVKYFYGVKSRKYFLLAYLFCHA
ncbi:MAG: hypothetical protein B6D37_01910 [Sphingobacteriales bacterium UTBCD1]|nr:MAG: hypothetical protein B6D37_01910 [Sphingobacteriales bacterium UTBCD1]